MQDYDADFASTGYAVVQSAIDPVRLKELQGEIDRFIAERVPDLPGTLVYYEDKADTSTLKQIQKLHEYSDYFSGLAQSPAIAGLANRLLGGPSTIQNMQYFNKVPHRGKPTPPHQDGYYFKITPQHALTMWLSLGFADESNGAVRYIPGSHRRGMRPHGRTQTLGFSQGIADWSNDDEKSSVQMEAKPGDLLVHHSLMIHSARRNESDRNRQAVGFIFYRDDVEVDDAAHKAYQAELDRSLQEQSKI